MFILVQNCSCLSFKEGCFFSESYEPKVITHSKDWFHPEIDRQVTVSTFHCLQSFYEILLSLEKIFISILIIWRNYNNYCQTYFWVNTKTKWKQVVSVLYMGKVIHWGPQVSLHYWNYRFFQHKTSNIKTTNQLVTLNDV